MSYRHIIIALSIFLSETVFPTSSDDSFVVTSTESTKEESSTDSNNIQVNPQIYSMQINANVSNRYARTLITSKVRNLKDKSKETTFSVILPENAFISEFEMEIKGKVYKAYVKEKEEAKKIYQQAVSSGQSAGHVELNARDSKTFTVSVNIEPESKTIFRLVYEELLQRRIGQYELIINIHPGQIVEDLGVHVYINESRPLTFVKTPSLRTGNEISKNDEKLDPSAQIDVINNTAVVNFNPDINQQKTFAEKLGGNKENGLAGQFVVQYDVERDPHGGEVLVRDGYFVHFFAPSELDPLPKHVVFVLDHSGSMSGRKIDQLIEAMQNILPQLKPEDLFNIIRFADDASVWNSVENKFVPVNIISRDYGSLEPHLKEANLPQAAEASNQNIENAKNIVKDKSDMGLTNIIAGLEIGLFLIKRTQEYTPNKYQPLLIFLTDGLPNVGMNSGDEITNTVTKLNSGTTCAPIFSLSFGSGADKSFLQKLSSQNLGFSRHIYEAADASLQLQDFYSTISSPLMSNITFKYVDGVSDVTNVRYPILFQGSELVVAGKTGENSDLLPQVYGTCTTGRVIFNTTRTKPVSSIERLWGYLTVQQILKERETADNKTELTRKALDLALKYSFVTSVSSLVVVKPNQTDAVDSQTAAAKSSPESFGPISVGMPGAPPNSRSLGVPYSARGSGAWSTRSFSSYPNPFSGASAINGGFSSSNYGPLQVPQFYLPRQPYPVPIFIPTTTTDTSLTQSETLPQWLEELKKNNQRITTPQGSFQLGQKNAVTTRPSCPSTPTNTTGVCTIIFDCPEVFTLLTDINVYLKFFCPLNDYAGVCCPVKQETTPSA
ncbi:inter-alpha-trypsin inhibitor heavy chain H4-like isoform X2 [Zophobas morio]|uniref:inter-alpha-trypsin inhibitor heavy chain H4-like isoform X2 n=1 Tax=Zophobas morio TaxID=2755281 RepID=UPI003082C96F